MDPFTERMLERARARRQKLNVQLNGIGESTTSNVKTSCLPSKRDDVERKLTDDNTNLPKYDESSPPKLKKNSLNPSKQLSATNKENSGLEKQEVTFRSSARSRLKRLGALYSNGEEINDADEMPSPIHRSELKGYDDDVSPKKKPPLHTVKRLAALANHINHWEDDLSHPKSVAASEAVSPSNSSQGCDSSEGAVDERGVRNQDEQICIDRSAAKSPKKALLWDREVIASLESQGFRPSNSGSRLVYEYGGDPSQGRKVEPKGSPRTPVNSPNKPPESSSAQGSPLRKNQDVGGKKLTPRLTPAHSSILHRAAMFESPTRSPKSKDPAELSVAERKALFEKNKGQALVPKAAFSMAVPLKQLSSSPQKVTASCPAPVKKSTPCEPSAVKSVARVMQSSMAEVGKKVTPAEPKVKEACENPTVAASKVLERCNIFEKGKPVQNLENDILKSVKTERQRELEMLANRWNNQREAAAAAATSSLTEKSSLEMTKRPPSESHSSKASAPPPPPPLPNFSSSTGRPGAQVKGGVLSNHTSSPASPSLPSTSPHSEKIMSLASLRKIKVSPAKPGCLYPSLSDIEATESEMDLGESEGENESFGDLEREEDYESSSSGGSMGPGDTSFGREIFQAAGISENFGTKRHGGPLSSAEKAVLNEMDELLDEAIAEEEAGMGGPTPPKRRSSSDEATSYRSPTKSKGISSDYAVRDSHSSRYVEGNSGQPVMVQKDEGNLPLMHTISFYRKQQAQASPCPNVVHHVNRNPRTNSQSQNGAGKDSDEVVQEKIKSLLEEVNRQQTIIYQASQALNLCSSTVEFSESAEQVEGERLLLIATHRRQAALNEIQRIKVEGTLWPKKNAESQTSTLGLEKGDLDICDITLPLKKEFLEKVVNGDVDLTHHFVCLVKHQENVIATEMLSTASLCKSRLAPCLRFRNSIRLSGLYSDFKVALEIYGLQVRKEILSHEAKYHIRKESSKIRITPKKLLKQESNLIMPIVQSPAGPHAVRSTAFSLAGYVVFSLRELSRVQWTLNKVPYSSPLEGVVQMKLNCLLEQNVEERGFLTMFEDISGFGAWHRRWCLLHDDKISFWKYPEDERKKEPIGWINLNACLNENVGPVPRHICARPNTFLLETKRAALPEDRDSLVLVTSSTHTTIRHLLSADSKEERQSWCMQINKAIRSLRAWGPRV